MKTHSIASMLAATGVGAASALQEFERQRAEHTLPAAGKGGKKGGGKKPPKRISA